MLQAVKRKASNAARRAGFSVGGLLCLSVGAGFLTVAAWAVLRNTYSVEVSALIMAAVFSGAGFILLAFGLGGGADESLNIKANVTQDPKTTAANNADAPPLVQAFLFGLQAGINAEKRQPH
ncbi:phage holin family protein [Litoreibacter roseus]|uniref:Uncharacterized protein n=1 Tax=Litoreibacter roseus TaxID=2601869 RepID=A0A6N6JL24_9RHOB|nr:phage holin family protein [Litoreibacter roseus]GFE66109.1 hypothetical protein KIN_31830 [Litoreibacter roseus]